MEQPYYKYSQFLKDKYGEKTYKLPVNLPTTCPNRDGNLGREGCYFCGEEGADFEMLSDEMSVKNQLLENKDYIGERYGVKQFIAYFQNFTNTYLPLEKLKGYVREAVQVEGIKAVYFSTRPDTINRRYISEIKELKGIIPICSNCKKIRDDDGYWQKVENYIQTHSNAEFSHGLCPECRKNLYPDLN